MLLNKCFPYLQGENNYFRCWLRDSYNILKLSFYTDYPHRKEKTIKIITRNVCFSNIIDNNRCIVLLQYMEQ